MKSSTGPSTSSQQPTRTWVPHFVLWLSLAVTAVGALLAHRAAVQQDKVRFARAVDHARIALANQMENYSSTVRNMTVLYQLAGIPTRKDMSDYLARLDLVTRFPGTRGVGFSLIVKAADREEVEKGFRKADVDPNFHIWPLDPPREQYHTIMYLEPANESSHWAIGFDMHTEPIRAAAMDRARDTGMPASTGKIALMRASTDSDNKFGFVHYMAIYKGRNIPATVAERREKIYGYIFAPFWTNDLFRGIYARESHPFIDFRIYDGSGQIDESALLFDSAADRKAPEGDPWFSRTEKVDVVGGPWTMEFVSTPEFNAASVRWMTPLFLGVGTLVSLMFFGLTRSQVHALSAGRQTMRELEQSKDDLLRSESRASRLADANLVGVATCRLGDRVFTSANDEFLRLVGKPRNRIATGLINWDPLTPAEFKAADQQAMAQLRSAGVCTPFEREFLRSDGSRVAVLVGLAMLEGSGEECAVLAVDISQRKQFELELQEAKTTAESANTAKDRFLAVLSHELRTPLAPIMLATSLWEHDASLPEALRGDFEMIRRNVELEARLIEDLLDLTRIGRGKLHLDLESVDLHDVIRDASEIGPAREAAAKGLKFVWHLDATETTLRGDTARLKQIFWNLLSNAVKFTPTGGRVDIRTANVNSESVRIAISDTGIGIESKLLPMIFEAFEQGEAARSRASGGLGLGLAIVRGLVQAHGGHVDVVSPGPGQGSTFTVELPTVLSPNSVVNGKSVAIAPPSGAVAS